MAYRIGLDIGSTTIKCVVLDERGTVLYQSYERHLAKVTEKAVGLLTHVDKEIIKVLRRRLLLQDLPDWVFHRVAVWSSFRKYMQPGLYERADSGRGRCN